MMNVLIFVMTMLMLLSMMTYARLETYRNTQVYQLFFNKYMEEDERGFINVAMEQQYIDTVAKVDKDKDDKDKVKEAPPPQINATPRISLNLLIDKSKRKGKENEWKQTKILLKNLMIALYKDAPFFKEIQSSESQALDQMIESLEKAVDDLPADQKITQAADLANIHLSSGDDLFCKMLKEISFKVIVDEKNVNDKTKTEKSDEKEDQDDSSLENEGKEYKSAKGHYSLLDFINLSPKEAIRVYLAPREVLLAAFSQNGEVVDEIIAKRKIYYKSALDGTDVAELKKEFSAEFIGRRDKDIDEKRLDFSVSKTNPAVYSTH